MKPAPKMNLIHQLLLAGLLDPKSKLARNVSDENVDRASQRWSR